MHHRCVCVTRLLRYAGRPHKGVPIGTIGAYTELCQSRSPLHVLLEIPARNGADIAPAVDVNRVPIPSPPDVGNVARKALVGAGGQRSSSTRRAGARGLRFGPAGPCAERGTRD